MDLRTAAALLLVLASSLPCAAQERLREWRSFTRTDGLPSNGVLDVLEDPEGDVWTAGYGGVARYDRSTGRWESFLVVRTLDGEEVSLDLATSLACQDDLSGDRGSIWVGTDGQGLVVRRPDGSWEVERRRDHRGSLPSDHVHALLYASDGALWAGLDGSVARRLPRSETWEFFGPSIADASRRLRIAGNRPVYTLHEDAHHRVWAAGYDFGAHAWFGDRWVRYDDHGIDDPRGALTARDPEHRPARSYIYAVRDDAEGNLWFCGFGGGLALLEGKRADRFLPLPGSVRTALASQSTCDLLVDEDTGDRWFATYEGLTRLAADGSSCESYRNGAYFRSGFFRRAHFGRRTGTLWFANRGGGLVGRIDSGYRLWDASGLGLPEEGRPDVRGGLAIDEDGSVWGATERSVFRREREIGAAESWGLADLGLPDGAMIQCLHADEDGTVWVGSSRGLSRWIRGSWERLEIELEEGGLARSLEEINVWDISRDRSARLWLATRSNGALYRSGEAPTWHRFSTPGLEAPQRGLPSKNVFCVFQEQDERARPGPVWFGTEKGLARWDEAAPADGQWQWFTAEQGLSSNRVYAVQRDRLGALWLGTLRAIDRRLPTGAFERIRGEQSQGFLEDGNYCFRILSTGEDSLWFAIVGSGLVHYDTRQGQWTNYELPGDLSGVAVRGVAFGPTGRLWIATSNGLLAYDRDHDRPRVRIPKDNPRVLPSQGSGSFFVEGRDVLHRTPASELRYRFRIDDGAWSAYQSDTHFRAEGLAPGDHRLEVQALDRDFNLSPSALHLFRVEIPWWRSPVLLGLVVVTLLALALGAAILRFYDERRRREIERSEVLSAAVSGMVQSGLPSFLGPARESSVPMLAAAQVDADDNLLRSGLQLEPDVRLSSLAAQLVPEWQQRCGSAIHIEITKPVHEPVANLDAAKLRLAIDHLLRNAVEALEEGSGGRISIEIERLGPSLLRRSRLVLRVRDDGPGIPDEVLRRLGTPFNTHGRKRHAGLGLFHCHQIATLHRGSLRVRRGTPRGTVVEMRLSPRLATG